MHSGNMVAHKANILKLVEWLSFPALTVMNTVATLTKWTDYAYP